MNDVDANLLRSIPLSDIQQVTFYKRDELTTDLICCDVEASGQVWTFNEEVMGWDALLSHLEQLSGFQADWFSRVGQPPFEASETIAFSRL
jgi:hypothetical protein